MANISPTTPLITGVVPTSSTPTATTGDTFDNQRGDLMLRITNGSGSSINATLTAQQTTRPGDGVFPPSTISNNVVAIANGATKVIGPIPPAFNDVNGKVTLVCSAVSSVTVESYRVAS